MREFWKQTAILAVVGFILGLLVGLGFQAVHGIRAFIAQSDRGCVAQYLVLSGLLGAVNMGTATVYSLERWGILRCTLTHFVIAISSVCAVGFALGWLSLSDPVTLWMLAASVVAYFLIWLIMYRRYKRKIRRINEALNHWKAEQDEK